jgi:uncharacterized membrane protein YozB (DUF420 family)
VNAMFVGSPFHAGVLAVVTAPAGATITLVVMIVAAVLFTIGAWFARQKKLAAHGRIQTLAFVLNLSLVVVWMIRSFFKNIWPGLPGDLDQSTYLVTTVHAAAGLLGVLLGLYVVLLGWERVPEALQVTDFKPWMRASFVLYLLVTLGGILVYVNAYVVGIF